MKHALPAERELFVDLFNTQDQREGVNAFLEKRAPTGKRLIAPERAMTVEHQDSACVIFTEHATPSGMKIGYATLNAEKSLNALSLEMIRLLDARLRQWADDPQLACVVLQGAGEKAFCAGGDDAQAARGHLAHEGPSAIPFASAYFAEEYRLDYRIHTYAKPILLWGSGIVMGGGLG